MTQEHDAMDRTLFTTFTLSALAHMTGILVLDPGAMGVGSGRMASNHEWPRTLDIRLENLPYARKSFELTDKNNSRSVTNNPPDVDKQARIVTSRIMRFDKPGTDGMQESMGGDPFNKSEIALRAQQWYPLAAARLGLEGRVILSVRVSTAGEVVAITIKTSSGSNILDEAAMDGIRGLRFHPARPGVEEANGWIEIPIVFRPG